MEQSYKVVYEGKLRRGQTRAGVAGRLSERLGRDRSEMEKLLAGPERVILRTDSESKAQHLLEVFTQAGAQIRLERPAAKSDNERVVEEAGRSLEAKPAVRASFGQRIWLVRAAGVLSFLVLISALGLSLLVAAWIALWFAYDGLQGLSPWLTLVFPLVAALQLLLLLALAALVKPFVRLESRLPHALKLERANERGLFDFVDYVCEVVGAPYPRAIYVDSSARVSAGLRRGYGLTIGLSFMGSATTAQLGGMVARALTLHTPGVTGRLGRFVTCVVERLHTAVHERDDFDRALDGATRSANRFLAFGAKALSKVFVYARRVLEYLLKEAVGSSAAAMQSMEWHRDRYQVRFVGADRFPDHLLFMRLLEFAAVRADQAVRDGWSKGQALPSDMPGAVQLRLKRVVKSDQMQKALAIAEREQEPVAAFHVADAKRIERTVKRGSDPGIVCTTPARQMLHGYTLLSRRLTLLHYRNRLALPATSHHLVMSSGKEQALLDRFSGGAYLEMATIAPARFSAETKSAQELVTRARAIAQVLPPSADKGRESGAHYRETMQRLVASLVEENLLRGKRSLRKNRARAKLEEVEEQCRSLEARLEKAVSGAMAAHGELIARRLANGVSLLEGPETAQRLAGAGDLATQGRELLDLLDKLQRQMGALRELTIHLSVLEVLLSRCTKRSDGALRDRISEQEADIGNLLTGVRIALKRLENPLQRERGESIFDHARAGWVATTAAYGVVDESSVVVEGVLRLRGMVIARLAVLTEAAEAAWDVAKPAKNRA